jgi:hypothetical protein
MASVTQNISQNLNTAAIEVFQILVRLNGEDYRISRYHRRSNFFFFYGELARIASLHNFDSFRGELRSMMFVFFVVLQVRLESMFW